MKLRTSVKLLGKGLGYLGNKLSPVHYRQVIGFIILTVVSFVTNKILSQFIKYLPFVIRQNVLVSFNLCMTYTLVLVLNWVHKSPIVSVKTRYMVSGLRVPLMEGMLVLTSVLEVMNVSVFCEILIYCLSSAVSYLHVSFGKMAWICAKCQIPIRWLNVTLILIAMNKHLCLIFLKKPMKFKKLILFRQRFSSTWIAENKSQYTIKTLTGIDVDEEQKQNIIVYVVDYIKCFSSLLFHAKLSLKVKLFIMSLLPWMTVMFVPIPYWVILLSIEFTCLKTILEEENFPDYHRLQDISSDFPKASLLEWCVMLMLLVDVMEVDFSIQLRKLLVELTGSMIILKQTHCSQDMESQKKFGVALNTLDNIPFSCHEIKRAFHIYGIVINRYMHLYLEAQEKEELGAIDFLHMPSLFLPVHYTVFNGVFSAISQLAGMVEVQIQQYDNYQDFAHTLDANKDVLQFKADMEHREQLLEEAIALAARWHAEERHPQEAIKPNIQSKPVSESAPTSDLNDIQQLQGVPSESTFDP